MKTKLNNNITLRPVTTNDLHEVARMWDFEKGKISLAEAAKAIHWMIDNHQKNQLHKIHHVCWALVENGTNKIIGWCGLDGRNLNNDDRVNIFYLIDKNHRRRGYATACAAKLLEHGFGHFQIEKIDGACAKDNIGSIKVMEKLGMRRLDVDDKDSYHYLITLKDYHQQKACRDQKELLR